MNLLFLVKLVSTMVIFSVYLTPRCNNLPLFLWSWLQNSIIRLSIRFLSQILAERFNSIKWLSQTRITERRTSIPRLNLTKYSRIIQQLPLYVWVILTLKLDNLFVISISLSNIYDLDRSFELKMWQSPTRITEKGKGLNLAQYSGIIQ